MLKIKRALISVSDKTGVVELAEVLKDFGVEIVSTGGTARALKEAGIDVVEMSDYTGFPEMLDGRVKTLHPKIHGGLLARRDNPEHLKQAESCGIGLIDMVVVNLYPFEKTVARAGVTEEEAIENIDIGGPSMLRSAAKNHASVAVVSRPQVYPSIIEALKKNDGRLPVSLLKSLAADVFELTARYDAAIARYLRGPQDRFPVRLDVVLSKAASLRYGENPHQQAGLYRWEGSESAATLVNAEQLHGKELSFNNYLDLNAALENIRGFARPCACIIKHTNPTGVAQARTLDRAFREAWQSDPLSAFGGIVGLNRPIDAKTARALLKSGFLECILAPAYDPEALALLKTKKNLRLLQMSVGVSADPGPWDVKRIDGGLLVQDKDAGDADAKDLKIVTHKKPTRAQMISLLFAWEVAKHVKSNAIVLARGTATVGIGMGETSRVDSMFMAVKRAGRRSRGAVLASDAFFPKSDNIALAKKAGIKAVIQPGGSIADEEIIRAADKAGIAMIATGVRHFKH